MRGPCAAPERRTREARSRRAGVERARGVTRRRGDARLSDEGRDAPDGPTSRTTVLLADDHAVVRQGLRALLAAERDLAVVGEAQDGRQAVDMVETLHPDVVVMDIAMPRLNGIEATRQILDAAPTTRVLVLSAHADMEYVTQVTRVGAAGFVSKRSSLNELATAIRTARMGGTYVSPSIPWREPSRVRWTSGDSSGPPTPTPVELTPREAEVLQSIAESRCNKEIARDLGISVKTVEKHRQSLMTKLDIHDVAGLTRYAVASGVVECCSACSSS